VGYKAEDLGEVLEGDRMVGTPYDVSFRVDRDNESLCKKELNAKDLKKFRKARPRPCAHFSAQPVLN